MPNGSRRPARRPGSSWLPVLRPASVLALLALAAVPARAEIDLSGSWVSINHEDSLERGAGPNPADWAGLPFNDSGRAKALAFNQSVISEP